MTYDRAAIMTRALADARQRRACGSGLSWQALVADALRSAWLRAKLLASIAILTAGATR